MKTIKFSSRTLRSMTLMSFLFCFFFSSLLQAAEKTDAPLTNASDVLALPASKAALGIPVSITGTVTAAETNWHGRFFMQDSSAGVFVECINPLQPVPGDVVKVTGITRAGGYAPCVTKPHWEKMGTAPQPNAKPVTIEQLMSGTEDSQRIEISGVVRRAWFSGSRLGIELASGGYRLRAFCPQPPKVIPQSLVGAKVTLRGTAAAAFNAPLRHIVTVTLFVPQLSDFVIKEPAPADPFTESLTPLNGIAQYRKNRSPANQVHVKGILTYQRKGEAIFLRDASVGLQIKTKLTNSLSPGDVVEAVGFPAVENFLPILEDATVRKVDEPKVSLKPRTVTIAELQKGLHHADFIKLQGRIIDRLVRGIGHIANKPVVQTSLVLQATNFIFVAEKDTVDQNSQLASIPIGSLVEVSGICLLDSDEDGKIKSLHLLLPTSHDVQIIQKPSWLTPRNLLTSLTVVFGILLLAISWTVLVSKKNSILKSLVREKEATRNELQKAHDQLEERVKERTDQLKIEMTARKESELQFRAVLTERTRLAQELHDTLEQTMTGIALQLDLVASQFQVKPDTANHHLKLARNLMKQSQVDLRYSVWGLRTRAEEQFNLLSAITISSRQIANSAHMNIQVETSGESQVLSEIVEENLLRIGQEAVTNAVKHSEADTVMIQLEHQPSMVVLQIRDNGKGFVPENCAGPKDGHFGLLGIKERTERLNGHVMITSQIKNGTCIRVEIPIDPVEINQTSLGKSEEYEESV